MKIRARQLTQLVKEAISTPTGFGVSSAFEDRRAAIVDIQSAQRRIARMLEFESANPQVVEACAKSKRMLANVIKTLMIPYV